MTKRKATESKKKMKTVAKEAAIRVRIIPIEAIPAAAKPIAKPIK